ncbi:MAG: D-alanine--D-alanine ligase, partial [Duodenibacillus sp.]|nr:D-alanine--D-alanine ligase [Duodenibacillus sp.]
VDELREAIGEACRLNEGVLVEERIFGRELTIAVVDGKALPVIEIRAPEGDYDYHNKYFGNAVVYDCPAKLDAATTEAVCRTAEAGFAALGARGWGRIDLMMREDGSFVLLELNTSPGMTPHSLVPMAARAVGVDYAGLCLHIASRAALDYPKHDPVTP